MCQRIGRPPISTIGLGRVPVSSVSRVPIPPARITAFIRLVSPGASSIFDGKAEPEITKGLPSNHYSTLADPKLCILRTQTSMTDRASSLRRQILELSAQFHAEAFPATEFKPGITPIPVSGKVIDGQDLSAVVDSALDCWFTTGRFAEDFERKLARF